jgi:hypothetical protein
VTTWTSPAGLLLLALFSAAEAGAAEPAAAPTGGRVDAEMLRDLDLLTNPDYVRDREVARRMGLFERLRMLENQSADDAATSGATRPDPARPTSPAKETR